MSKAMARIGATLFAACLTLTACQASGQPKSPSNTSQAPDSENPGDVKVNIGVITDAPGFNQLTPGSNVREGFDYKLYNWLANHSPKFRPVPVDVTLEDRLNAIVKGDVELVVANFAITDERRKYVGFAGPYMFAHQGIMVRSGDQNKFHKTGDLAGKSVCVLSGSTSLDRLKELPYRMVITPVSGYSQCITRLLAGEDDVVSSDDVIMEGLARTDPTHLSVVKEVTFGNQEKFGVGLPQGNVALCETVTAKLKDLLISNTWDDYFKQYFPDLYDNIAQYRPDPNNLDRCT